MAKNALAKAESLPYEIVVDTDDRDEWLAARNLGLGASDIGGVLGLPGVARRSSPLKVFMEKTGVLEPEDLSNIEAIEWGHEMEPVIARRYAARTGRPVELGRRHRYQVLRSKLYPWALCSLDFWTADAVGAELRPLEVKNVSAFMAEDWLDGTPDYYYAQVQQQLLVTGQALATSACCIGGNKLAWCDVPRDEVMIRKIIFHGELMWTRIQQGTPPEPDGSEATLEVLKRLYPQDDGSCVELPATLIHYFDELLDAKAQIKRFKKIADECDAAIKATLGVAREGYFATGDRISWKTHTVREHVVKEHTQRPLLLQPRKEQ
jgi:putative phage-type endonuclease